MLSRSDFCKLTGMTIERFKSLARRNQLPFTSVEEDISGPTADAAAKRGGKGWRTWTPDEALKMIVADDLTHYHGLDIATASAIVSNSWGWVLENWNLLSEVGPGHELWIGACRIRATIEDEIEGSQFHVGGTISDISEKLNSIYKYPAPTQEYPYRLILANISSSFRVLIMRAAAADIDIYKSDFGYQR